MKNLITIITLTIVLFSASIISAADTFRYVGSNLEEIKGTIGGETLTLTRSALDNTQYTAYSSASKKRFFINISGNKNSGELVVCNVKNADDIGAADCKPGQAIAIQNADPNEQPGNNTPPAPGGGTLVCPTGEVYETVFGKICVTDDILGSFIGIVYAWVAGIIGTLSLLGLIYAGFLYITATGNPDQIGKAKDTIVTSITALIIILFSYGLIKLLIPSIK